jgi:tetratricopeptide (TPR) repeat protein
MTHYQGFIALHNEAYQEAQHWSAEAVALSKRLQDSDLETITNLFFSLLNLGEAEMKLGKLEAALAARQEALELAKNHENQLWTAYALDGIAEVHHENKNKQVAETYFQQALELFNPNHALNDAQSLLQRMKAGGYKAN